MTPASTPITPLLHLLDTNVLLALIRGKALGRYIDASFNLRTQPQRPLVCIVSHGEIWALARQNRWGAAKRAALENMLNNLVPVDINHPAVIDAYVEIDDASRRQPKGAVNMGKNDMWIAAVARVTGATLLTTDGDFDHLIPGVIQGVKIDPASKLPSEPNL